MQTVRLCVLFSLASIAFIATSATSVSAAGKPLKIFIMAGQSNMQGTAKVRTIERLNLTEDSKQMYADMNMKNGIPSAVKDTYCVYFTAGDKKFGKDRALQESKGPLKPGLGGETTENTSFGPEYTFGIYMQKHLNQPILIIKCAWGGRDLVQQFRPPSGGKHETKDQCRHKLPNGYYYHQVVKHVNTVLADPGKYHPAYNKAAGVEIAGFVWFQGFNDMIQKYPKTEYGRLLACFIRDIRKDLKVPKMPFVIGVMGIGGVKENDGFRKAQAAPAALPEFKGNVVAVRTGKYWDTKLGEIQNKVNEAAKKALLEENPKLGGRALSKAIGKKAKSMQAKVLKPDEVKFLEVATSNAAFHYMGSAYIYGNIGKSFADAMAKMLK